MDQNDDRLLSLTIAVTGHRDILPDDTARIRSEFEQFMRRMAAQAPGMTFKVLSGAAMGADLLLTEAAMDLRDEGLSIRPLVVLPMPEEDYLEDFAGDPEARSRLLHLKSRMPGADWTGLPRAPQRDACYQNLADLLVNRADLVVAVWNGDNPMKVGGTADIVKRAASAQLHFTAGDGVPGRNLELVDTVFRNPGKTTVYVIQANRRADTQPLAVGELASGYLDNGALVARLNAAHRPGPLLQRDDLRRGGAPGAALVEMLGLVTAANRDLQQARVTGREHLGAELGSGDDGPALQALRARFQQFDRLAQDRQAKVRRIYTSTALLTLILAFTFLVYAKLVPHIGWLVLHIATFVAGLIAFRVVNPNRLKYQFALYRAAAESLRIEYFWVRAGIVSPTGAGSLAAVLDTGNGAESHFIGNLIRGAFLTTAAAAGGYGRLNTAWLGDQRDWYRRAAAEQSHRHHRYESIVKAAVFIPVALGVVLVSLYLVDHHLVYHELPGGIPLKNVFTFLMGFVPICGVAAELMNTANAHKELGRQYQLKQNYLTHLLDQLGADPAAELWQAAVRRAGRELSREHMQWLTIQKEREIEPAHGG